MVWSWFYIAVERNMRRLVASLHDNGLSMILHSPNIKHAPPIVLISRQWSEHGFKWPHKETCGGCYPLLMTMIWACFYTAPISNMLRLLSLSHGNGLIMVLYCCINGNSLHMVYKAYKETCGGCCLHLMTVFWAWFYIAPISNMRWVLSSSHGNGLSLVLYCRRKKHEATGVWQWSEHDFTEHQYQTCAAYCPHLKTMVWAWF